MSPSTKKTVIKAAKGQDTATWIIKKVIPNLRAYAVANGEPVDEGRFRHLRMSATEVFRDTLKLGGSHVRVIQVLTRLRVLTMVERQVVGKAAKLTGPRPPLYSVNMTLKPDARAVNRVLVDIANDATEARRRRRLQEAKEERLAGQHGTEAEGGPVETTKPTDDHGPEHNHTAVAPHRHEGREGLHSHLQGYGVLWADTHEPAKEVEWRHHTHQAKPPAGNGTRAEVVEDLSGGKAAILVRREGDQRYRDLVDIIEELKARVLRAESRAEKAETEAREYRDLLERATDPSAEEADAIRREFGKL